MYAVATASVCSAAVATNVAYGGATTHGFVSTYCKIPTPRIRPRFRSWLGRAAVLVPTARHRGPDLDRGGPRSRPAVTLCRSPIPPHASVSASLLSRWAAASPPRRCQTPPPTTAPKTAPTPGWRLLRRAVSPWQQRRSVCSVRSHALPRHPSIPLERGARSGGGCVAKAKPYSPTASRGGGNNAQRVCAPHGGEETRDVGLDTLPGLDLGHQHTGG